MACFLREMIGFAAERLMDLEVGGMTGAAHGERSPDRLVQRNGYRQRDWVTRAGTVELRIPKLRRRSSSRASSSPAGPPKLGKLMDDSEEDVLAYMAFPTQHRTKLHSVNTLERLNKEVKRRADVVGIFPSEASIIRLIGAVLLEANDEWQLQHRYMGVEAMGEMLSPPLTNETLQLPPKAP